jgi:hypothetical protein
MGSKSKFKPPGSNPIKKGQRALRKKRVAEVKIPVASLTYMSSSQGISSSIKRADGKAESLVCHLAFDVQEHKDGTFHDGIAFYAKVSLFNVTDPQGILHRAKHWQWTLAFSDERDRCVKTLGEIANYFQWKDKDANIPFGIAKLAGDIAQLPVLPRDYIAPEISMRELGSILAGLRLLQAADTAAHPGIDEIANGAGDYAPLSDADIDTLCERLNTTS